MRFHQTVLLTLAMFTAFAASAQTPLPKDQVQLLFKPDAPGPLRGSVDAVVARIMSFDRNSDGVVEKSELPERMQSLLTRGDIGRDGALDDAEIRKLATTALVKSGFSNSGGYTFGDQVGLSSRSHIEGALDDLRLDSSTKEAALPIVKMFVDNLEANASTDLLIKMERLLTAEQLVDFKSALDRQGANQSVDIVQFQGDAVRTFAIRTDLERRILRYGLELSKQRQALATIAGFRTQQRLGDAGRLALLEQMKNILSEEERDNFRAALERRPLVKAGGVVGGVVGGISPAALKREIVDGFVAPETNSPQSQQR